MGFPVSLSRARDDALGALPPHQDDRKPVGEVDFFSDRNKSAPADYHGDNHDVKPNNGISVKKENSHGEPIKSKLDVNVSCLVI